MALSPNTTKVYFDSGLDGTSSSSDPGVGVRAFNSNGHSYSLGLNEQSLVFGVDGSNQTVVNLQNILHSSDIQFLKPSVIVASNVISRSAGEAYAYKFPDGRYLVGFTLAFTTTTNRSINSAVFKLQVNGVNLVFTEPYSFTCTVNDGTVRMSNRLAADTSFVANPVAWNANSEFRINGFAFAQLVS